ncbi:MAG TPA: hypothetical protein VM056_04570 [Terriglobales bacterium]|nr:hypothetical protein [Terriglobales bacterium]
MLRSLFAIIGGYITFAVGLALANRVVVLVVPSLIAEGPSSSRFIVTSLVCAGMMGTLGGFMAGLIAGREPRMHGVILAVVCALYFLLFLGAPTPPGEAIFPVWYKIGLLVVVPPAVTIGGFLRSYQKSAAGTEEPLPSK